MNDQLSSDFSQLREHVRGLVAFANEVTGSLVELGDALNTEDVSDIADHATGELHTLADLAEELYVMARSASAIAERLGDKRCNSIHESEASTKQAYLNSAGVTRA